jgi:hypothetical protein
MGTMGRLQPGDKIQVVVTADWAPIVEAMAAQLDCSYGEAIAHLLGQALPASSPAVDLTALETRLAALERDRRGVTELAVLSDRLTRLERTVHQSALGDNPGVPAWPEDGEEEDEYDDEPDEILYDFLNLSPPSSSG